MTTWTTLLRRCTIFQILLLKFAMGFQSTPSYQLDEGSMQIAALVNNSGPIDVHVSVAIERLINVDMKNSRYSAIINVVSTWRDPEARKAAIQDTAAALNGTKQCSTTCTAQSYRGSACCDNVFVPYFYFGNEYSSSELQSRIAFGDADEMIKIVKVKGDFYQRIVMGSYPFGTTQLLAQINFHDNSVLAGFQRSASNESFAVAGRLVRAIPSATSAFTGGMSGRGSSQWRIKDSILASSDDAMSVRDIFGDNGYGQSISPGDPLSDFLLSNDSLLDFPLQLQSNLLFSVTVEQNWQIGFVSSVLPIILLSCMTLIVLLQDVLSLNARISSVIGMFFSLTNIQSNTLSSSPNAEELTPIEAASFVLYVMLFMTMLESVLVSRIASFHSFFSSMHYDFKRAIRPKRPLKTTCKDKEGEPLPIASNHKDAASSITDEEGSMDFGEDTTYSSLLARLMCDEEYCVSLARTVDRACFIIWILIYVVAYLAIALTTTTDKNYVIKF